MEIRYNITGEERRALVKAVGEVLGMKPKYMGAPGFAYAVGSCTIDREGALCFEPTEVCEDELRNLLTCLAARGYEHDEIGGSPFESGDASGVGTPDSLALCEEAEPESRGYSPFQGWVIRGGDSGRLSIEVPLEGFTATALSNLEKLVAGKGALIRKALGAEALTVERLEDRLSFPWFNANASPEEIGAYAQFVAALCETAKTQKRVILKEKPLDEGASEKFAFRCFLLKLGFIGDEYKDARKFLLSKLTGNGSHKTGSGKKSAAKNEASRGESYAPDESEAEAL